MKDHSAGLKTDPDGRRYFRSRRVEFQTVDVTAAEIHGMWLQYTTPLVSLNWQNPDHQSIREFARQSSERFLDFWYKVLEVAFARSLALRDTMILRLPLFKSDSFFDAGIPEDQTHSTVGVNLHTKIIAEYNRARQFQSEFGVHYISEYLEQLTDDIRNQMQIYHRVWDLRAEKSRLGFEIVNLETRELSNVTSEERRLALTTAQSALFHATRSHRLRLRLLHLREHGNRGAAGIVEHMEKSRQELEARRLILRQGPEVVQRLLEAYLRANQELEALYVSKVNPFLERAAVKEACQEILKRLRPLRRTTSAYSLIPGERHGAMSLNPVLRLWKDKPNPRRSECKILDLEINTKHTIDCLIKLNSLADPELENRTLERGRIARAMRGTESFANLLKFLLPGSCYPLREVHPLDFPEFRSRVIGETRSPVELGANEPAILTGAWYSKRQHALYVTVGADNARLLSILWNSARAPGPPAFFFAMGQFVHDCLKDDLIYRRTSGLTFRECAQDYFDLEDKIRKNRGEKTGRRRIDNSRFGVRFMFAVLYSRLITELLTGSFQSQFRHSLSEQWMEKHLGLTRNRERLRMVRVQLREIIRSYDTHLVEETAEQ